MKTLRTLAFMAITAGFLLAPADKAHAQVAVSIGEAPVCPYGYYEAPPYNCAPDGYYGPEWFGGGGIFIGAGPWYHGSDHFYGHVDHKLDRHIRSEVRSPKGSHVEDWVVSGDGKILTETRKGTGGNTGRVLDEVYVYDKQPAGAK
jgi:hypothetical protein